MGIDKIKKKKKKKPNQLVSKSKNGKRPGYYGSDDYGSGEDGQGPSGPSGGGGGGGDSDDNYMDYYSAPAPAPAPAPSYSVQDDIGDFATNVGSTASVAGGFEDDSYDVQDDLTDYATNVMKTADPEGGFEDDDTGDSLYVSPTQIMKEKEFAFKPDPFTGPYVDARDDPFTTARNTNTGIFDSGIGKFVKNAAKVALPFVAAPIAGLVGGKTAMDLTNLGFRVNNASKFANKLGLTNKTLAQTFLDPNKRTNVNKPPTGFNDNDGGENNIIAKNVVASNVQKYSPEYINRAIDLRDRLQPVQDRLNEKGQMTLASLNKLIEQYQV